MRFLTAVLLTASLAACARAHSFPVASAPDLSPVPADSVTVYQSEDDLPCPDYQPIARLEASGDWLASREKLVGKMREEAARHGATEVILTGYSDTSFGAALASDKEAQARALAVLLRCEGR